MHGRKTERGQAIGELLIGLIGLCIVMIGLFMISGLGMVGVRNTIAAREDVDRYSLHGETQGQGHVRAIDTWATGQDGLRFTYDDTASAASNCSPIPGSSRPVSWRRLLIPNRRWIRGSGNPNFSFPRQT